MNQFLHGVARAVFEAFDLPGPVLEVGSYQVEGETGLSDLRRYFPGKPYTGLDMRAGPGVDVVANVEELPWPDGHFGTVLALSTFEHVQRFWRGLDEVYRVLRPDGALLIACPFHFHIHAYPNDYWRFTPEALKLLLERYPSKLVGWHGPPRRPGNVWALAFREARPPITPGRVETYRRGMARHAREPLSPLRRLRYLIGRALCGSRPFAPWLQRERWQIELVQDLPAVMRAPCPTSNSAIRPRGQPPVKRGCPRHAARPSPSASSTGTAAPSSAAASAP